MYIKESEREEKDRQRMYVRVKIKGGAQMPKLPLRARFDKNS